MAQCDLDVELTSTVVCFNVLQLLHIVQTAVGHQGSYRVQQTVDTSDTARLTNPLLQFKQPGKRRKVVNVPAFTLVRVVQKTKL